MSEMYLHSDLAHPCRLKIRSGPLLESVKRQETVMISEAIGALVFHSQAIQTPPGDFPRFARLALSPGVRRIVYQHPVNIHSYFLFEQSKIVILCLNRYFNDISARNILIVRTLTRGIINGESSYCTSGMLGLVACLEGDGEACTSVPTIATCLDRSPRLVRTVFHITL